MAVAPAMAANNVKRSRAAAGQERPWPHTRQGGQHVDTLSKSARAPKSMRLRSPFLSWSIVKSWLRMLPIIEIDTFAACRPLMFGRPEYPHRRSGPLGCTLPRAHGRRILMIVKGMVAVSHAQTNSARSMPRDGAELYKDLRLVNFIVGTLGMKRFICAMSMHRLQSPRTCAAYMQSRRRGTHVER